MSDEKHFSDRAKVITRVFDRFVQAGRYTQADFHAFCNFAKGKSESELLRILSLPRKQIRRNNYV